MKNLIICIKHRMMILGIIILAGIFTSFIDSFSNPLMIFIWGIFIGVGLIIFTRFDCMTGKTETYSEGLKS